MGFRLAADAVLVLHLGFILFALFGGLLALRWRRAPLFHLPAVAWAAFIEISAGICPLTPLENGLRALAGQSGYAGGFIEHHLLPLIYPAGLTRGIQLALAAAVLAINLALYLLVWCRRRR